MPSKTTRIITFALLILLLLSGFLLLLAGVGFNTAQSILGNLSADGTFDALTVQRYALLRYPLIFAGLVLVGAGFFLIWKPQLLHQSMSTLLTVIQNFPAEAKEMGAALRKTLPQKTWGWILLGLILITGIFARGLLLNNSLSYDESYTYINFIRPGLDTVLMDYHVPNNHVFHSVLGWISTSLFSVSPVTLRLTAFIAGIACILLVYMLGSATSHPVVGYVSAAAISIWPWLVYYGKNARGYTLLTMFALLLFLLLTYLKNHRNLLLWCCVPVIVALGAWTMPTMLYPTAAIYIWFLSSALIGYKPTAYKSRWRAIAAIVISGGFAVLLTGLLYSPIIIWGTGLDSLINNHFLRHYPQHELIGELGSLFKATWGVAFRRVEFLRRPVIIGWALHLLFSWRKKKFLIPQSIITVLVILVMLFVQRVVPYDRTWIFLFPFLFLWSAEGWMAMLQFIQEKAVPQKKILLNWASLFSLGLLAFGVVRMLTEYPEQLQKITNIPNTAQYLKDIATDKDWIVPNVPEDMPYHFYHAYYGLDANLLQYHEGIQTIYVIDSRHSDSYNFEEEITQILENNGIDPAKVNLENAKVIQTFRERGDYYSLGNTMVIAVPVDAP